MSRLWGLGGSIVLRGSSSSSPVDQESALEHLKESEVPGIGKKRGGYLCVTEGFPK